MRSHLALRGECSPRGELAKLVRRARAHDADAWAELHQRYSNRLRAVARTYRLSGHDVEDVVQASWVRCIESIDALRDPSAVGAWLETTVRRECLRLLTRGRREQPAQDGQLPLHDAEAPSDLDELERRLVLTQAIARLPAHQARLLAAMIAVDASYERLSVALGMPVGAIGPTRKRAIVRLRQDEELLASVA
jgi:RNA polymerase sigma factor (sigma-70 family)